MSVSCGCCGLSGRGICDGLITRPEESYRVRVCVCVCDREAPYRGGRGSESARSTTRAKNLGPLRSSLKSVIM